MPTPAAPSALRVRPLFALLAALVLGILLAPLVPLAPTVLIGLAASSLFLGLLLSLRAPEALPAVPLLFILPFALIGAGQAKRVMTPAPDDISRFTGSPSVWVEGVVASEVETRQGRGGTAGASFTLAAQTVDDHRSLQPTSGYLRVTAYEVASLPSYGDTLRVRGHLEEPEAATNPGAFDYRTYLRRRGVFATLLVSRKSDMLPAEGQKASPLRRMATAIRTTTRDTTRRYLRPDDAALMDGLLLSARDQLPAGIEEAFARTGTVHLLSVSGLHLTALAAMVAWALSHLPGPRSLRRAANVSALLLLWSFALAAGGSTAAVRAAVMVSVFLLGPLLRRAPEPLHALAFAAFVLLLFDPLALFDAGFQLSFATVGTLLLWAKPLERLWLPWEPGTSKTGSLARGVLCTLAVGVLAHLGSAPLVAYHFNRFSLVAPLANIPLTLLGSGVMVAGLGLALASPLLPVFLAGTLWGMVGCGLGLLRWLAGAFAAPVWASVSAPSPPFFFLFLWYALLVGGALFLRAYVPQKTLFTPPLGGSDSAGNVPVADTGLPTVATAPSAGSS